MINDGLGKVCRWDGYAETAAFPRACFTASKSMMTNMLVFVLVVCWGFWGFFLSLPPFAPILSAHPGLCPSLQSCHSLLRCFLS